MMYLSTNKIWYMRPAMSGGWGLGFYSWAPEFGCGVSLLCRRQSRTVLYFYLSPSSVIIIIIIIITACAICQAAANWDRPPLTTCRAVHTSEDEVARRILRPEMEISHRRRCLGTNQWLALGMKGSFLQVMTTKLEIMKTVPAQYPGMTLFQLVACTRAKQHHLI